MSSFVEMRLVFILGFTGFTGGCLRYRLLMLDVLGCFCYGFCWVVFCGLWLPLGVVRYGVTFACVWGLPLAGGYFVCLNGLVIVRIWRV